VTPLSPELQFAQSRFVDQRLRVDETLQSLSCRHESPLRIVGEEINILCRPQGGSEKRLLRPAPPRRRRRRKSFRSRYQRALAGLWDNLGKASPQSFTSIRSGKLQSAIRKRYAAAGIAASPWRSASPHQRLATRPLLA
jgi:hypothetical protein